MLNTYYIPASLVTPVSSPFLLPPWVTDPKELHFFPMDLDCGCPGDGVGVALDESRGELGFHVLPGGDLGGGWRVRGEG